MTKKYNDDNYYYIVNNILDNDKFKKLDNYAHHGITRLEHCKRVSYYSYKVAKLLKLDYKQTARAALLHDFFYNDEVSRVKSYFNHAGLAVNNAKEEFALTEKEEDIIATHMFPVNINKVPKYMESWIVSGVDKVSCVYESLLSLSKLCKFKLRHAMVLSIFLLGRFM